MNQCFFKILPFTNESNFTYLNQLLQLLKDLEDDQQIMCNDLKERKKSIQELKNNIQNEYSLNMNLYNKQKGLPVFFATQSF